MASEAPLNRPQHLVFASGKGWYALPAACAVEVIIVPKLTPVPGAPAHLLGVFSHRGEMIPVIDLPVLLGLLAEKSRRAVLVRVELGAFALTLSQVAGVSGVEGALEPIGATGVTAHLKGPGKVQTKDVSVIEPKGLLEFLSAGR